MIQSKLIKNYKNISHGFFNKQDGYSKGIYKSLNCGIGSKDKKIHVKKNLNKVCKKIGCSTKNLVLLKQIHSNKVYVINKKPIKKLKGDSIITNKKRIALGILSADCAPVFIFDPKNNFIGAIHAGWKGLYKKIISKTNNNFFFIKKKKFFFSLNEYISNELRKKGVENIEIIKKDTYLNKNNFFSSRRSLKKKLNDYGRNISIIMIK